jgi:hypothetical protein
MTMMKPNAFNTRSAVLVLALVVPSPSFLLAQGGSLTPPGAPAPTMKTLDQIEPRKPIDATNTPGDGTNVFRITASGSYYLAAPLTGVAGKNGISIEASDVTVDLRGFTIAGIPGSLDGMVVTAGNSRLAVRNGRVSGWGGDGIDEVEGGATDGIYENVHASGNTGDGLRLGNKCTVKSCSLTGNLGYGVSVDGRATFTGCTAGNNGLSGFYFGAGSVLDSLASSNADNGFESFDEPVLMKDCVAYDHANAGFRTGGGGKVTDCISRDNGTGIDANYFSTVTNCMVKNNGWGVFAGGSCHISGNMCEGNGEGISTYQGNNVVDGNRVINGGTGIKIAAPFAESKHNVIIRNVVGRNTENYDIAPDNRYGPIVDITATGTSGFIGAGNAASTLNNADPWANFAY